MYMEKSIELGSDHAGYELKAFIINYLKSKEYTVNDHGCYSTESVDYPDYAHNVANALKSNAQSIGILICGSGNGINITANKYKHIRAALCWNAEIAQLARLHNDANVLTLPGRYISNEEAIKCVDVFLNTAFEGGRHLKRVEKITACL
jgi:ribose 5-phosphate isomerase B